jgi:hypothetical protein
VSRAIRLAPPTGATEDALETLAGRLAARAADWRLRRLASHPAFIGGGGYAATIASFLVPAFCHALASGEVRVVPGGNGDVGVGGNDDDVGDEGNTEGLVESARAIVVVTKRQDPQFDEEHVLFRGSRPAGGPRPPARSRSVRGLAPPARARRGRPGRARRRPPLSCRSETAFRGARARRAAAARRARHPRHRRVLTIKGGTSQPAVLRFAHLSQRWVENVLLRRGLSPHAADLFASFGL